MNLPSFFDPTTMILKFPSPSFSAKVFFKLNGKKHEHESDTRYRNKKDAKQNAAYVALVALDRIPYVQTLLNFSKCFLLVNQ